MNLRDQLNAIYAVNRELTPKLVVDVARDAAHPLHERFEWDDEVAGERYREVQAADLIRSVRVKYLDGDEERDVRGFLAIPRADQPTSNYVPVEEVAENEFNRMLALKEAEREWKAMRRRHAHLTGFFDLVRKDLESAVAS